MTFRSIGAAALVFGVLQLGACATPTPDQANAEPKDEKIYRTGSNIPVRDRSAPSDVKTVDPETIQRSLDRGTRGGAGN